MYMYCTHFFITSSKSFCELCDEYLIWSLFEVLHKRSVILYFALYFSFNLCLRLWFEKKLDLLELLHKIVNSIKRKQARNPFLMLFGAVVDPGGTPTAEAEGLPTYYLANFLPKNAWKWKKLARDKEHASRVPPTPWTLDCGMCNRVFMLNQLPKSSGGLRKKKYHALPPDQKQWRIYMVKFWTCPAPTG